MIKNYNNISMVIACIGVVVGDLINILFDMQKKIACWNIITCNITGKSNLETNNEYPPKTMFVVLASNQKCPSDLTTSAKNPG